MTDAPSTVSIALSGVELMVRIGEHKWEQHPERPSRIALNIALEFGYADYFNKHGGYVNYDPLRQYLKSLEQNDHINRLEDFAKRIIATCFETTPAQRVRITVMKPDIFPEMDAVGLALDVARADFAA